MSSSVMTRRATQKSKIQTRSMGKNPTTTVTAADRQPSSALQEAKKKARQKLVHNTKQGDSTIVKDIYQVAMMSANLVRGATGLVYDRRMAEHRCLWDGNYPECPERFTRVIERCEELQLIERCQSIDIRVAKKEEILTKHTEEQYNMLMGTQGSTDEAVLEDISSRFDAIYIHPTTFDLSLLAVGCTIQLVDNILTNKIQNGMAIIRPPGHHAMKAEYNGYCFFNNVAIAVQYALDNCGLQRVLVVDWDVHHGQGTQRMFYDDPRVVYFSIHRYEHGSFWPNLRESDFDYIGEGDGRGFNFNVPLNRTGMTNADYLAVFQQILMPVAMEFQPELVVVSAGYDAAFGCPEGEMEITPACYSHLLSPLLSLAEGRVAVVLEGGYCLNSLAEGAALTLKTLLGDVCPKMEDLKEPNESIQETILNCIYSHRDYWKCLQLNTTYTLEELNNVNPQSNLHNVVQVFKGGDPVPVKFETRDCYPVQSQAFLDAVESRLGQLRQFTNLKTAKNRVCYVYDDEMGEHHNLYDKNHLERPERIIQIKKRFNEFKLFDRLVAVPSRLATTLELSMGHTRKHVNLIRKIVEKEQQELEEIGSTYNSVYFHPKTFQCASMAAGSVIQVVDSVLRNESGSGVCIVRPPGHHAEPDLPHGFCIFNNVAIAAKYAIEQYSLKRVLIMDWDIHHGNGTQHIFESNPNVLYISLHRFDNGNFFPKSKDADYSEVGKGAGEGFNVNIPWNRAGMADAEYMAAFQQIILPIAYEFNPELVLISAGFDAAIGDPLGGCKVTPEAYGYFTHWLSPLANGRIVLCLEGGYNVNSISYAMTMCTKALLGDPLPMQQTSVKAGIKASCVDTIQNVLSVQQKYWKSLKFNKKLPDFACVDVGKIDLNDAFRKLQIGPTDNNDENTKKCGNSEKVKEAIYSSEAGPSKPKENTQTLSDYLAENAQALANEEMFAVIPLKTCPHLSTLDKDKIPSEIKTSGLCINCDSPAENWFCLGCNQTFCGRYINEHMMQHHLETDHPLTLSFSDLSVWCYKCENYIDNPILHVYKNLAHLDKFGEELVWSYGDDSIVLLN